MPDRVSAGSAGIGRLIAYFVVRIARQDGHTVCECRPCPWTTVGSNLAAITLRNGTPRGVTETPDPVRATSPFGLEIRQRGDFRGKGLGRVDPELRGKRREIDPPVAHDPHDDGAAPAVVGGQDKPALDRKPVERDRPPPVGAVLEALPVGVLGRGDRRDPESVERGVGRGAVSLEIPVERPVALGDRELVVGPGEVVQANVDVARGSELRMRDREHRKPLLGCRKLVPGFEDPLGGLHPRHMGIAEDRKPVRAQRQDVVDRAGERRFGLPGQAVDQVDVDRREPLVPEPADGLSVELLRLPPVDRKLDFRVGVLDPERRPVGADHPESLDVVLGQPPGVDLHPELASGRKEEGTVDRQAQAGQLLGREEGRGSAAEVHLAHRPPAVDPPGDHRDFPLEVVDVLGRRGVAPGDDRVAAAVPAERLAERQMEIERDRTGPGPVVVADRILQGPVVHRVRETVGRRIGRVPRSGDGVLADEPEVERGRRRGR